jgi:hypothetical protein
MGDQDHDCFEVSPTVPARRLDQRLNLGWGEAFADPQLGDDCRMLEIRTVG